MVWVWHPLGGGRSNSTTVAAFHKFDFTNKFQLLLSTLHCNFYILARELWEPAMPGPGDGATDVTGNGPTGHNSAIVHQAK